MHNEQVFTPHNIVELMLNHIGYIPSNNILDKYIIDNSCGNGAFLCEIADRYIKAGIVNGLSKKNIIRGLEGYIYGIEIVSSLCNETIKNLNKIAAKYSLQDIHWNIINTDAIDVVKKCTYKMDYVVGNPPYCKVHDLTQEQRDKYKKFCGDSKGTFDSYVMFFWIGIQMLKPQGKLSYITPSSWTTSLYARELREYLRKYSAIISIIDMKHEKVFDNATTFTMITEIGNKTHNEITPVYEYNNGTLKLINNSHISQYMYDDKFYFKNNQTLNVIKEINTVKAEEVFEVKNGFATLKDKLFIGDMSEMAGILDDPNIIFCTKASKNILQSIIYPYDKDGKPVKFEKLGKPIQTKLLERAKKLENDTTKEGWYLYGRSQAINDIQRDKYSINNLIKTKEDIKLHYCTSGTGVYSGFYIVNRWNYNVGSYAHKFLEETLNSDEFVEYVHSLGRYKNGGYSTFTTKELKNYLNYKWLHYEEKFY